MNRELKYDSLFVDGVKDRRIVNKKKQVVSIEDARKLWESGKVKDFNMSFQRLATRANWDWEELERQYAEMDKARGT